LTGSSYLPCTYLLLIYLPTYLSIIGLSRGEQHLIMEMLPELFGLITASEQAGDQNLNSSNGLAIQQTAWASIAVLAESLGTAFAKVDG
jgi:hypothetical protein